MQENNATTWRDIADQLTPEQITELEVSERGYRDRAQLPKPWYSTEPRSDSDITALMLHLARRHAADNLADEMYGGVPDPAGAVEVYGWGADSETRVFDGSSWVVNLEDRGGVIEVRVQGEQQADGGVRREIAVHETDLTVEQARRLADAIRAACDEAEQMNAYDTVVTR
jgi:hypothetical protein